MLNFKDIAKIFEEIELRLIASLKRNLMRHKAEEIREDRQWTAWQAIKLQNLQKFRRENRQIMQEYSDKIDADTRQLMTEQFREGEQEAEAVAGAEPAASVPDVHFFGVNTPKMERLMQDVVQVEQTAETAALRTMDDVYRRTVNRAQLAMAAGETTLTKAIDMAVREFLEKGLNSIVYRDGRHVDIADYVRMVLRTTSTRAQLQGKSKRFAELGYDTVLISQYGGCSETCEPWQGRAYIDDVFTIWNGEINGDSGKSRYCDKWFPLLSSAIRGGLFHPNCRHTMSLYIDGVTKIPPPIPAEQMQRQRELEARQRAMERKIRKLKRLEAGTQDPQAAKEYGREARAAQQELKVFVDEHRDVLKRDYEREKYYGSGVDKSGGSGIISVGSGIMYRKAKVGYVEPMPKKQLHRIEKSFKSQGGLIQYNDETDIYLKSKNAEAITYNEKTILIKQNPGRASVYEELIHATQYRNGENDGSYVSRLNCEIEAQRKLLRNSKAYKLTEAEIKQTKSALQQYENELKAYYEKGGD